MPTRAEVQQLAERVDQELAELSAQVAGQTATLRQNFNLQTGVLEADLNAFVMGGLNLIDNEIIAVSKGVDEVTKPLDKMLDREMFGLMTESGPLLQTLEQSELFTSPLPPGDDTGQTFCVWANRDTCECRMLQGIDPPLGGGNWILMGCTQDPERDDPQVIITECQDFLRRMGCGQPPPPQPEPQVKWSCDPATRTCFQDPNGQYDNPLACIAACVQNPFRWECNRATGQCYIDPNGSFSNFDDCRRACSVPPPPPSQRWECNRRTGDCYPDPNGSFSDLATCMAACERSGKCPCVTCPAPVVQCPPPLVDVDVTVEAPDPEKEKPCFTLWQQRDSKVCLITKCSDPPPEGVWDSQGDFVTITSAAGVAKTICPPPTSRPDPDPRTKGGSVFDLTSIAFCEALIKPNPAYKTNIINLLSFLFGTQKADGSQTFWGSIKDLIISGVPVGRILFDTIDQVLGQIDQTAGFVFKQALANDPFIVNDMFGQTVMGLINSLIGGGFQPLIDRNQLAINRRYPSRVPTPDDATAAFLGNSISKQVLDCWVEMAGLSANSYERVVDGRRSKLSPLETTALWRRQLISAQEHAQLIRGLGFTDAASAPFFRKLSEQIPFVSDLIRMMVRDTADDALVQKFGMDDFFTQKFTGQVKEWSDWQGVTEDHMKHVWRAHWRIPSAGQLFEMYHRLRHLQPTDPEFVDLATVEEALRQDDVLPFWIPKLLAISFRPMLRRDIRRAYEVGAIDRKQVERGFLDLGSNDSVAKILTDYTVKITERLYARSATAKLFRDGGLTESEAKARMTTEGAEPPVADRAIALAREERKARIKVKCTKAVQDQFVLGEIDSSDASQALSALGHDPVDVADFLQLFGCLKASKGKRVSAATLCGWAEDGLISGDEYLDRLIRLGFEPGDASNLVQRCELSITRKQRRKIMQARKEAVRLANKAERSRKQRIKAEDKRLNTIAKAAETLSQATDTNIGNALIRVTATFRFLQQALGVSLDNAATVVVLAADRIKAEPSETFEVVASQIASIRGVTRLSGLATSREQAQEESDLRLLQCVECFNIVQSTNGTQPLDSICPVCNGPLTILEINPVAID